MSTDGAPMDVDAFVGYLNETYGTDVARMDALPDGSTLRALYGASITRFTKPNQQELVAEVDRPWTVVTHPVTLVAASASVVVTGQDPEPPPAPRRRWRPRIGGRSRPRNPAPRSTP
jgi:hypothetical protein